MSPADRTAEQAYLHAQELEEKDQIPEALVQYQSVIDQHGYSLFADAACQAIDRIEAGDALDKALAHVRTRSRYHPARPLTVGNALRTTLPVVLLATVLGPVVAGSWILIISLSLEPLPFIYLIGGLPAALGGFLFSIWALCLCHWKRRVPVRFPSMGAASGALSITALFIIAGSSVVSVWKSPAFFLFMLFHSVVAGLVAGGPAGKIIHTRMSLAYPPYETTSSTE